MKKSLLAIVILISALSSGVTGSAILDPNSVEFKTPQDIHWVRNAAGTNEQAVLFGDPSKPGPYVVRIKWLPGNFSRPHFHNSDRFFVVISGTWWVGTGNKFDPDNTVPIPTGSYVIHKAGQVHFDGAKNEETIIQVTGDGPVTTTSVPNP
ncbi:MAG: cupin domain-containing protein [Solimonas sp.]